MPFPVYENALSCKLHRLSNRHCAFCILCHQAIKLQQGEILRLFLKPPGYQQRKMRQSETACWLLLLQGKLLQPRGRKILVFSTAIELKTLRPQVLNKQGGGERRKKKKISVPTELILKTQKKVRATQAQQQSLKVVSDLTTRSRKVQSIEFSCSNILLSLCSTPVFVLPTTAATGCF